MSEGIKKVGKSFVPYVAKPLENPSVGASIDPLGQSKQILKVQQSNELFFQQQSTDQPFSSSFFFNPQYPNFDISQKVSYDGPLDIYNAHQRYLGSLVNSSLDSKLIQKPQDVFQSQNRSMVMVPLFFQSPRQSYYPHIPLQQSQQGQNDLARLSNNSLDKQIKTTFVNVPDQSNQFWLQKPQQQTQQVNSIEQPKFKQQNFKKEDFNLLDKEESCESEVVKVEESSWNAQQQDKNSNKIQKRIRKRFSVQESSDSFRITKKKKGPKVNDTKNITKNYSKAIISYILNSSELLSRFMTADQYENFVQLLKTKKNQMTNIKQLRDLWVDGGKNQEFNKVFRIISQYFLKYQAVSYVYNSRISNTAWHLKYRQNLLRALKEPENFKFIKDI